MMKPYPKGLVSLARGQQSSVSDIGLTKQNWQNPNISAVRIKIPWPSLEPDRGVYDFSVVDAALAMAAQTGKPIGLSVGMGYKAPQWVYDRGAAAWTAISGPDLGTMPLQNDPKYLRFLKEFLNALGAHCDSNPKLSYIAMEGFAQSNELYCANSDQDNTTLLNSLGGVSAWLEAAKVITGYWMHAFPTTPLFIALAKPFLYAEGLQAEQDLTEWGKATYSDRFGVMCNSLSCRSNVGYYPNLSVSTYRPSGFQMVGSSNDERMGGTLTDAMTNGISIGGQFIEVYQQDVENPDYQRDLAAINSQLSS
jgi:hypothetical protein